MSYSDDVAPASHRVAMALFSLLFAFEVLFGLAIFALTECVVTGPGSDMHTTSCGQEYPWRAPIFFVVAVALYAGTRWLEARDRTMGLAALGMLVTAPMVAAFIL